MTYGDVRHVGDVAAVHPNRSRTPTPIRLGSPVPIARALRSQIRWTSRAIWAALARGPSRAEAIDHSVSPGWTVWVPWVLALGAVAGSSRLQPERPKPPRPGVGQRRRPAGWRGRPSSLRVWSRGRLASTPDRRDPLPWRRGRSTDRTIRRRDRRAGEGALRLGAGAGGVGGGGWGPAAGISSVGSGGGTVSTGPFSSSPSSGFAGSAGEPSAGEFSSVRSPACPGQASGRRRLRPGHRADCLAAALGRSIPIDAGSLTCVGQWRQAARPGSRCGCGRGSVARAARPRRRSSRTTPQVRAGPRRSTTATLRFARFDPLPRVRTPGRQVGPVSPAPEPLRGPARTRDARAAGAGDRWRAERHRDTRRGRQPRRPLAYRCPRHGSPSVELSRRRSRWPSGSAPLSFSTPRPGT